MFTELDGSKGSLGAELIDMSGKFLRRKLFSYSYAFIQEWIYWDNSAFSYPLYYLDNSTAFLKDDWASTSTPPVVRLSWSLGAENCSQAQLNSSTYACQDNKSVCLDYADEYTDEEFKGYFCRCVEGYEGNPYLPKGCQGTTYLEANLSDLSGQQQRSKFLSCSYVFVNYNDQFDMNFPFDFLNNSKATQTITLQQSTGELMLDWRIGSENCSEAKLNHANFACQGNSECIEFDTKVGGYLCICSEGYQGNPYITSGCQDIDECADNTINRCNAKSSCNNTQGSVTCLCPKGYYGDGMKDGIGCINLPQVMSKQMIILIGMGSGLGFLVLLLLLFWLYKVLRKRKEQMIKEKFFKRNGGLLFQQQTNEGVFGKTKIFQANELVVATDNFNESRILGQGGQGTVYKGMLSDGKIVAIKKI